MITARCPGHITCIFAPGERGDASLDTGSRGIGIRTAAGAGVSVSETSGTSVRVVIDGKESEAPVTRNVMERMAPGRGFEVYVENDLPVGQGFGMSAAGAVCAALCAQRITGAGERAAWEAAHCAEIECGGGLGDVSAIMGDCDVPVRIRAGLPPAGEVRDSGIRLGPLSVAVLGGPLNTGDVLRDGSRRRAITEAGTRELEGRISDPGDLFAASNRFSSAARIESTEVSAAIRELRSRGYRAAMCMLGNSIFSDCPAEEMREAFPHAFVRETSSTSEKASVTRSSRCV